MKKYHVKYSVCLPVLLLFFANWSMAQTYAERTLYADSFSTKNITSLEVVNKYGSIQLKNWDKDSIKITTDVYLSASSREKLDRLKDGVKIKYHQFNNTIVAQTIFGDKRATFIKELQYLIRDITPSSEKHIEINYEVFLPTEINIDLQNQYGDIFLDNVKNNLKIDQANGSFKAHNLTGDVSLKFSFVNAMVNDIKDGFVDLNYSSISLNKSVNLRTESKMSDIYAHEINVLKISSSRDKINIDKLDYLFGSASYTKIKILELNKEIDGYFTYGQIMVDKLNPTASVIDIDSERTDIKLYISKKISYTYDILYHVDADIILPNNIEKPYQTMETEEIKSIKGSVGTDPSLDIRIRALKRCLIQIYNSIEVKNP